MTDMPLHTSPITSLVIEYEVPEAKQTEFSQWKETIRAANQKFEGFLGTDVYPPLAGTQDKWHVIVHFDTPLNLVRWLDSDTCHEMIKLGRSNFSTYQLKTLETGLEAWLSDRNSAGQSPHPPAWKQNFAVLFGLYPVVLIETLLFTSLGLMKNWSLPHSMLVSLFISCSLLTWIVMPLVTRVLQFWLQPKSHSTQVDIVGTLLVFAGLGFMVSFFHLFKM